VISTDFIMENSHEEDKNSDKLTDKEQKSLDQVIDKIFSKM